MADVEYLDKFEDTLEEGLKKVLSGAGFLDNEVLRNDDIDSKWESFARDYVSDAVENFNDYPEAAIAFSAFLGMAVAHYWDTDWEHHSADNYTSYYGSRGWDDMDEHVLWDILRLQPEYGKKLSDAMISCAVATLGLIRHQGIEAQTPDGFYVLVRAYEVMYRLGASIELKRDGYHKVALPLI